MESVEYFDTELGCTVDVEFFLGNAYLYWEDLDGITESMWDKQEFLDAVGDRFEEL